MQYLNTTLWETFDKTVSARIPEAYPEDPKLRVYMRIGNTSVILAADSAADSQTSHPG